MFGRDDRRELELELSAAQRRIAELEAERSRTAYRDPLTGLVDVRAFRERVSEEVGRSRRYRRPLSLALVDLDEFRALQAQHGFRAGDEVLVSVGRLVTETLRAQDVVCRTSADEFALLLPETTSESSRIAVDRLLVELETIVSGEIHGLSASAGIASFGDRTTGESLLADAGRALDLARRDGGGKVVHADDPLEDQVEIAPAHQGTIEALAHTLLARDEYTADHSASVVDMTASVARNLGLDAAEIDRIRAAALLHDIGKVAIPDDILQKQGPLDEREWEVMRTHPVIGERILRAVPGMGTIARIVRHEHERWDGGGYPDGIGREEIPIGSRIILACDAYDAMTTDRPYRKAMSHADALEELTSCAGSQFDPEVVGALVGVLYGRRQTGAAAAA